ncbi:MAG: DUF5009 domain-containing protein [Bacteroidota bacterium]
MPASATSINPSTRLLSLDFLRGFIMVLLAAESTGLYAYLNKNTTGGFHSIITQFTHHPWKGLHFWDLVQPAFMFMAGTAMAFSLNKQWANGVSWKHSFVKISRRCGWLFFWGVLDYAVRPKGLSFELWDVLTQLSFTTMVAFLVFRWRNMAQVMVCVSLLILTEILYRYTRVPGFEQPFTDQHNFGNYVDLLLMNKINRDGWVAINCIPTAVHTIAGALAGKWLLSAKKKLPVLLLWALVCFTLGYGLHGLGITPIIKRIATSAFTLASLGWCLCFLALSYWWIDIKNHRRHLLFFTIVGMNSIFIYVFFEIVGDRWFTAYIRSISDGVLGWVNMPAMPAFIIGSICVFTLEWLLCYFLYKRKIFFKL